MNFREERIRDYKAVNKIVWDIKVRRMLKKGFEILLYILIGAAMMMWFMVAMADRVGL